MKIKVIESAVADDYTKDHEVDNAERLSINVANVFDLKVIKAELLQYDINVDFGTKRHIRSDIWAIPVTASASSNELFSENTLAAEVYLYVDYENVNALAMSRKGSDKETMMLIASVANKYIREPFVMSKLIRNRI